MKRLTKAQISVLLTGLDTKLDRSSLGWAYEVEERIWRVYYPVTPSRLQSLRTGLSDLSKPLQEPGDDPSLQGKARPH